MISTSLQGRTRERQFTGYLAILCRKSHLHQISRLHNYRSPSEPLSQEGCALSYVPFQRAKYWRSSTESFEVETDLRLDCDRREGAAVLGMDDVRTVHVTVLRRVSPWPP